MAFYIRKSVRVGPLRFNLSKSGIGVSAGIRGLRVGSGPRGNYVHMGRSGLYYRRTFSPQQGTSERDREPPAGPQSSATADTVGPMKTVGSDSVAQMVDSSSAALLAEINQKRKQLRWWPFALCLSAAGVVTLLALGVSPWLYIPLALVFSAGTILAYYRDTLKTSVVLMYQLDEETSTAYRNLFEAVSSICRCDAAWHISARGSVLDRKYHAGASELLKRQPVRVAANAPPALRTNLSINCLALGNRHLYFFPDRILVYAPEGVGAVDYHDLRLDVQATCFIENGRPPRDAQIVDYTWQYVNKNGSPDRRFNNNRRLPVCLYEEIRLSSTSGLDELVHVSRKDLGPVVERAVADMAEVVACKQASRQRAAAGRQGEAIQKIPPAELVVMAEEFHETLFDMLCCIIAADGHVSRSEKARVLELIAEAGAPWTAESVESLITGFVQRVRTTGYSRVVASTLTRVATYKDVGRRRTLQRLLGSLADADAALAPKEKALRDHFWKAVT